MPKPKIMTIRVLYAQEIEWLKYYFKVYSPLEFVNRHKPKKEEYQRQLTARQRRKFEVISEFTSRYIEKSTPALLVVIKSVFVFEKMDIFDACTDILGVSTLQAFKMLENWFEGYFDELFYMIPDDAIEGFMLLEGYQTA